MRRERIAAALVALLEGDEARATALALADRGLTERQKVGDLGARVRRRGHQRRPGGGVVVPRGIVQGEHRAVVAADGAPALEACS